MQIIKTKNQLRKIYKSPGEGALKKVIHKLDKHSRHFIKRSHFCILSTTDNDGNIETSPKGGDPGFVYIMNDTVILIPDWPGNNRLDSLQNIIKNSSVSILFFIPGMDETLRVCGDASITLETDILKKLERAKKLPITVIVIDIQKVFFHCARSILRAKLWNSDSQIQRSDFPSMGKILQDQIKGYDGEKIDELINKNKNILYDEHK